MHVRVVTKKRPALATDVTTAIGIVSAILGVLAQLNGLITGFQSKGA